MPSHYLNQCWVIVNWTLMNKLQWIFLAKYKTFHSRNCSWKYSLRNGGHFVQGEMSKAKVIIQVCTPSINVLIFHNPCVPLYLKCDNMLFIICSHICSIHIYIYINIKHTISRIFQKMFRFPQYQFWSFRRKRLYRISSTNPCTFVDDEFVLIKAFDYIHNW